MRIRKVAAVTMAACLAASALAGCGSKKSDEKVIKIGVFEPTTGENGGGGYQEVLGIRYANEMHPTVNIGGEEYAVRLVEVDNKSDKTEAVNAAQKLVSEKGSAWCMGSIRLRRVHCSRTDLRRRQDSGHRLFLYQPQVTEGNDYYFRVCFIDPFQGTVMANYAFQNGAKSAAVITQLGDDYSSGLGSYFKEAFAKLGGNIVSEEQFQTNQTDFKAILTNIKAADPDIIFAPSSITTAPLIIKQARELGITATIAAGDTWENSTIIENAGADSEGVVISTFFDEAEPANDEAAAFIKGFKEYLVKEKQEDIIPAVSALGYDSYLAAIKAIEDAGSTDTTAIRDALKNVEIDGVTGNITFNETGDANKDIAFIKTIKDGRFQFLTTTTVE